MNDPQQTEYLAERPSEPVATIATIDPGDPGATLPAIPTNPTSTQRLSRRLFLGRVSSLTAVISATAAGFTLNVLPQTASSAQAAEIGPLLGAARADKARDIRVAAANFQRSQPLGNHPDNGDETRYSNRIASYSKALPHNTLDEVNLNSYAQMITALSTGTAANFEAITLGGPRKLVNPQAAYHYTLEGADSHALDIPPAPQFASAEVAGEMGELYAMALARDVYFGDYATDATIGAAVTDLNSFSDFRGPSPVTRSNIFRGTSPGTDVGPYVSQFLYLDVPEGVQQTIQKNLVPLPYAGSGGPSNDFMTGYSEWLNIQNGQNPTRTTAYDEARRYIRNGRDLAEYVHFDYPYQAALNAANIIVNARTGLAFSGDPKFSPGAYDAGNPYLSYTKQSGFGTFGNADLQVRIAKAAQYALDHAWYQKWLVHRRLRPEEFGGRIHNNKTGVTNYPIDAEILVSPILTRIFNRYGSYLLPQAFPEGAPTHPAYPSGHAVYIGAQVTMMKAYLKEDFVIPNPVVASRDGLSLQPVTGVTLTVGNELNKLAWNIALARNFAGVHYRSDAREGILLGEQVAIRLMQDLKTLYNEPFSGFTLKKFDGTTVTV
ncbi:MAG TPA: vanadium-dependent haloperoxidase [Herpetosiphonaceae bacterium]